MQTFLNANEPLLMCTGITLSGWGCFSLPCNGERLGKIYGGDMTAQISEVSLVVAQIGGMVSRIDGGRGLVCNQMG